MSSRRAVLAAFVLLAVAPAAAAPVDDPKAFVADLYARITAGDGTAGGVDFYEPATVRPKLFPRPCVPCGRRRRRRSPAISARSTSTSSAIPRIRW